ncbi:hypothetical protein JXA05_02535 [Candidatus Peregrinibacteria bacterium]|nr:hypothetical protein [Candidatus Peregrinibacteria bacterium]
MLRPNLRNIPYFKILLILWLVFSIIYVGWGEWSRFKTNVMERSYAAGRAEAIQQVIAESMKCKVFTMNVGETRANLVNIDCGKQEQPPAAPEEGQK